MQRFKIALFLPSLAGGGAERSLIRLADELCRRGYEAELVLAQATGPLAENVPPGVRMIDLGASRTLFALPSLTRYLRRQRPYGLIAAPDHANLVALWANLLAHTGTRVVLTNHIDLSISLQNSPKLQEKLYPFLLRLFHSAAHAFVSVSTGSADHLAQIAKIPRREILVIYNPVVTSRIDDLMTASPGHPWFASGQPPVVVAAGRLTAQKDYPTLLRAFAAVRRTRPVRLVILGEGECRQELSGLAESLGIAADLDLPGFVGNPYAFMARSGAFALSSSWEGLPTVLIEALYCGAQIVSTDCPSGPAEILENGKYGRLVPVGDVQALAQAIVAALDDPHPVEALRRRARAFSADAATDKYLDLLNLSGHDH